MSCTAASLVRSVASLGGAHQHLQCERFWPLQGETVLEAIYAVKRAEIKSSPEYLTHREVHVQRQLWFEGL